MARSLIGAVRQCRGSLLLEAVIATAVFTIVGSAVLSGLSTAHISRARAETHSVAENVGRNQMERLFSTTYLDPPSAYPLVATPEGYDVTADAEEYVPGDPAIEKIVVRVSHQGQVVLTLETLRVRE